MLNIKTTLAYNALNQNSIGLQATNKSQLGSTIKTKRSYHRFVSNKKQARLVKHRAIPCPAYLMLRNRALRQESNIIINSIDVKRGFTLSSYRRADAIDSNLSKTQQLDELDNKITSSNQEFNSCTANRNLTHISKENILLKVCSERAIDKMPLLREAKQETLASFDNKNKAIDSLDPNDPQSEIHETNLELEKRQILDNFISLAENLLPNNLFTNREREQYNVLAQDSDALRENHNRIAEIHKSNIQAYNNALQEGENSSDTTSSPDSPGSEDSGSESGDKSSSLLDDYADTSLEHPSYMDPED